MNSNLRVTLDALRHTRAYRILRHLRRWPWLNRVALQLRARLDGQPPAGVRQTPSTLGRSLSDFRRAVTSFNESQPNKDLLNAIRAHNHFMVDQFDAILPLRNHRLLDIGASPHGYALERTLELGVAMYVGVGLDIAYTQYVTAGRNSGGLLLRMDAAHLLFSAQAFDLILSISTFEHLSDVKAVLAEMARVLRPGGLAFVSFEPVWSCSYGHHLHHFGECAKLVPPWAHLLWTPDEMRRFLNGRWPANAPLSLEEAVRWVYFDPGLNRLTIRQLREFFHRSLLEVRWVAELKEDHFDALTGQEVSNRTGLSLEELRTKGLSVLFSRRLD